MELIECVPNISEGRRLEIVGDIAAAIGSAPGVHLLGQTSDPDHNRSVFTLAGSADGLVEAIRRLYAATLESGMDMRAQSGEHPRIGALDVVPFIPIQGADMERCVSLSREAGAMAAREFGVPVYLYADAAISPNRRRLAEIRRGGFEKLADKMRLPEWQPDFGPNQPHPALGASAFGARFFLIAYNLQLDTPDVEIARAVARAVRASASDGLPAVQAIGLSLAQRNCAQVSMNLLDYRITPVHIAQERVRREAARYGAQITGAELIGFIPQAAIDAAGAAGYDLRIEGFTPGMILENALALHGLREPA